MSILCLCHRWRLPSTTHLLAKFGPLTLYAFVEKEAISSWANNKRSTNTELEMEMELEMDISRNVHFNCIILLRLLADNDDVFLFSIQLVILKVYEVIRR